MKASEKQMEENTKAEISYNKIKLDQKLRIE